MADDPVLIAGAGASGLGAALGLSRRGVRSRVVDVRPVPGGMAAGWTRDGLPLRPGIHLLHASQDDLRPLVEDLVSVMGPQVIRVRPVSQVHFLDRFLDYPLRKMQAIAAMGPVRSARVFLSAAWWRTRAQVRIALGRPAPDSFETVIREAVGDVLYRLFFKDYTAKVIGIDTAHLAGEWARRRVPLPQGRHLLRNLMPWYRPDTIDHAHSPFHRLQVTGPDGIDLLFDSMLRATDGHAVFEGGTALHRLDIHGGRVRSAVLRRTDGTEVPVDAPRVVSTMPLTELLARLDPHPPSDIIALGRRLRYRGLVFVHLVLRRPPLLPTHWTYFQDGGLPFNRVSEYGAILPGLYGRDRTVVCCELAGDPGDALWESDLPTLTRQCINGLQRVTGLPVGDVLEASHVHRERHAYPAWHLGYQDDLARLLAWVDGIEGLVTTGRQGRFDYLNLDQSIAKGMAAAARI